MANPKPVANVPLPAHPAAFLRQTRSLVQSLWYSYVGLKALQDEWNAGSYGTNFYDPDASDGDLNGITVAEAGACIFDTPAAIKTVMDAGHATNLSKLL